jgi:hypothetical protein
MKVQLLSLEDASMARWLDPSRPPPPGLDGDGSSAAECAACWRPYEPSSWRERDVDAAQLPPPLMWSWCGRCRVATWYASVPRELAASWTAADRRTDARAR